MGQTRVDLRHLLEDLRDAYPGEIEETIVQGFFVALLPA